MLLRRSGGAVDGVLLLDKPLGLTSNAALVLARRLLGAAKAGHTGTLDPLATGLLVVCLGEATKFAGFLLDADKTYEAVIKLGVATTTGDAEGAVVYRGDLSCAMAQLDAVLPKFVGQLEQRPPMFSALKHQGRPLYEYAREGKTVDRPAREVFVHELTVLQRRVDELQVRVRVSKGTYIRTLAEDIGERLGCGAYLKALRRTAIGALDVNQARTLDQLQAMPPEDSRALLQPPDLLVAGLPKTELDAATTRAIRQGRSVSVPQLDPVGQVAMYASGSGFLGVGEVQSPGRLSPRRLLATTVPVEAA